MRMRIRLFAGALIVTMLAGGASLAAAQGARDMYDAAMERERALRETSAPSAQDIRRVVTAYEGVVRKYPASAYCDNALWQAANLALLAHERFGDDADRRRASRLLESLKREYASSSLVKQADGILRTLSADAAAPASAPPVASPSPSSAPPSSPPIPLPGPTAAADAARPAIVAIRDVKRTPLPEGVRVSIEMDGEALYRAERVDNPRRVFFDLKGTRPVSTLLDANLKFTDDIVREIRFGRHPQNTTRVVLDMEGADGYSVFTLYDPFRLVIDFKRAAPLTPPASKPALVPPPPPVTAPPGVAAAAKASETKPIDTPPSPAIPSANADGKFSLARQLGLGVSRIVIDAGHGGHDPGAQSSGLNESELVLDVAQRLNKLLAKQAGVEVVMTRDTDVFIPLEERTEIANREGADLFLSIHANASRNANAHGVETYFLNFALNPEAESVAARENSGSARTMHSLPEMVRAIALNNKIDESKDFASMVQKAMVRRLATRNKLIRDLGVKQAPFVVLIGASMPSVLAEISFVTNKQEGALLKTGPYRQQIAEALFDAVLGYQEALKKGRRASTQVGEREPR
jgi:N-acetylmuramoyl-L-alanine amidase